MAASKEQRHYRLDDPLPGNRSPMEYADMLHDLSLRYAAWGWSNNFHEAARIIRFLSSAESEEAWRAKHGASVFEPPGDPTAHRAIGKPAPPSGDPPPAQKRQRPSLAASETSPKRSRPALSKEGGATPIAEKRKKPLAGLLLKPKPRGLFD